MIILGSECNCERGEGFHIGNGGLVGLFRGEIHFLNLLVLAFRLFFSLFQLVRSLLLFL